MRNHRYVVWVAVVLSFFLLGGCSLYNPYISIGSKAGICGSRKTTDNLSFGGPGLKQACDLKSEIQSSRRQQIVTQNWIATGLVPVAALVGYRTARGLGTASTGALAAGGIAGYGVSQYLIQPSRLLIYDKGEQAISCALEIYVREDGSLRSANPVYNSVEAAKENFDEEVKAISSHNADMAFEAVEELADMVVRARYFELDTKLLATANLDANLGAAAIRIENEINTAMTTTTLPLTTLKNEVETLTQNLPKGKPVDGDAGSKIKGKPAAPDVLTGVRKAYQLLKERHVAAVTELSNVGSSVSYDACTLGILQVQPTPPEQPLQLGAGNVEQGSVKALDLANPNAIQIQLFGGRQPYDAKLADNSTELKIAVVAVGGSNSVVVTQNSAVAGKRYSVLVSDAIGSLRTFTVSVK